MKKYLLYKTEYGDYVCASETEVGIACPGDTGWSRYPYATKGELRRVATGRFVTLDHEPSPAEVRTLLEGPDPLSECLDALDKMQLFMSRLNGQVSLEVWKDMYEPMAMARALLEKYREGGK